MKTTSYKLIKLCVLLIAACLGGTEVKAQVPTCGSGVPYFFVDLRGKPDSVWESSSVSRAGNCCGTSSPDRCVSFEILLDTGAAALSFNIATGAIPPGSMFYQVGCSTPTPVGNLICLSGVGPPLSYLLQTG